MIKYIFFILTCLSCFNVCAAEGNKLKYLSIYDAPQYQNNFSHFRYVNPKAVKGGRLVLPAYGGFDNFNPFIFKGVAASEVAELTLESLGVVSADDETTVYPLIAKEFEMAPDKTFIGFILDERAKFSNGQPVLADDVIFSFNSLLKKGSPFYKMYYADVDRVEKINDRHIRFYSKKGKNNRELPLILSQFKIYSKSDWEGKDFAKPTLQVPIGSGPYLLEDFSVGKFLTFKRNPDYWAKDIPTRRGFFNFDEIRYDYYQDTTVTLQALFAGNIDMREEYIAKNWVGGYNNDLIKKGLVIKEEIAHNQPAALQYFGFNNRLHKFSDIRVRKAISLAFNFEWANENLFYNQYRRIDSIFSNTDMAAKNTPSGKELEILNKYKKQLPSELFFNKFKLPQHNNSIDTRNNLRQAVSLLKEAGYDFVGGKMTNMQTQQPLEIEVLGNAANGSSFTRVMLPFIENLKKIGIKMTFRNLEVNVFKNRLDNFDFEMAILGVRMSNLPGNELKELWGSSNADVKGSYNYMGIKNKVLDELINIIISSKNREEYLASIKALDRVIMFNYYFIPHWYSPHNRVAYRKGFKHPQTKIPVGFNPHIWWEDK